VFDHVTIRAADRDASDRFYATVLRTLGIEQAFSDEHVSQWGEFQLAPATSDHPATRRLHLGFVAPSRAHVHEFWRVGTGAGYRDDGAPGPRPQYRPDYYGSFLLDPDGNSAEAVHHGSQHSGGAIDHLWIRVADLAAAKRFYETIAPYAGLRLRADMPHLAWFTGAGGSFTLVADDAPTEHVHMAFPAPDGATVDAFHRTATEAGYRDNGAPGERPHHHPGYYGAFVLDPDGNNAEVVHHDRGGE
jgi:catechol 2,3-dioxygenase-like lactoylglutathione lyase family enzyme